MWEQRSTKHLQLFLLGRAVSNEPIPAVAASPAVWALAIPRGTHGFVRTPAAVTTGGGNTAVARRMRVAVAGAGDRGRVVAGSPVPSVARAGARARAGPGLAKSRLMAPPASVAGQAGTAGDGGAAWAGRRNWDLAHCGGDGCRQHDGGNAGNSEECFHLNTFNWDIGKLTDGTENTNTNQYK